MCSFRTSLEYFYALRRSQTWAIKAEHSGNEQWATAAWILEQALPSMVVEDHVYGPFPLCHVDLHHHNNLFDKDFNITGIIDWSGAQTVPLERFLASPEFATFPDCRQRRMRRRWNSAISSPRRFVSENWQRRDRSGLAAPPPAAIGASMT